MKKATILIVDKEKILVDLLVHALSSADWTVVGATSAEEGARLVDLNAPDLVVIDPSIEGGLPLVSSVRSGHFESKVVAVVGSEAIREQVARLGIETAVSRSDGWEALVSAIQGVLPGNFHLADGAGRVRLLICDDEDEISRALAEFFILKGYAVSFAKNGREAIERLEQERSIQIVLLDVGMPVMGGMDTLGEIMSRDPHPNVIMITALADRSIARQAMKMGAFDYIVKPFDFAAIEGSITACLSYSEYQKRPWWKKLTRS